MSYLYGEKSVFQYSTTLASGGTPIVALLGTSSNSFRRTVNITDLKVSCGADARTLTILGRRADVNSNPLSFDLPANSVSSLQWATPYRISFVSSTLATTALVASVSGAGVKFSVSGFID